MIKVKQDLTGKVFERLTVLEQAEDYVSPQGKHTAQWLVQCNCGSKPFVVVGSSLKRELTKSCGCLQKEIVSKCNKKYNNYIFKDNYIIGIATNTESYFYIDKDDYDKIKDNCWIEDAYGYIVSHDIDNYKKAIKLHRIIMRCDDPSIFVDHISHNKKDNRKQNLRLVTPGENTYNKSMQPYNSSGEIGVYFNKQRNQWIAQLIYKNKNYCRYCSSKEEAIKTRKELEDQYFGEYSYSNSMNNCDITDEFYTTQNYSKDEKK